MIKAGAPRQWLQNNNYLTEAFEWYVKQDDGHLTYPFFDENADMAQAVIEAFINYAERRGKDVKKLSDTYQKKVKDKFGDMSSGSDYGGYTSDDSSSDGSEGGDDLGGDDLDMDMGDESTDSTEETTEETTETSEESSESSNEGSEGSEASSSESSESTEF